MTSDKDAIELGQYQHKQPLLGQNVDGKWAYTPDQLAAIVDLDNHHTSDDKTAIISSIMLIEQFGGLENIAIRLNTDLKNGIRGDAKDIEERRAEYGKNSFPPPKIKTIWELVAENFEDTINQILLAAAIVSIIIGLFKEGFPEGLIEGTSIMISLCIIIVVNSGNNWFSERRLAQLVSLSEKQEVAIMRNGIISSKDSTEIVVGDIIHFDQGMKVPADMLMVSGQDVLCKEDELTGEPDFVPKVVINETNYRKGGLCTMMAKSQITGGKGTGLVVAVGEKTVSGVISTKTQAEGEDTLLQKRLETIANQIGTVGMICAALTLVAQVLRLFLEMINAVPCGCGNIFKCEEIQGCVPLSFAFTFENRLWMSLLDAVIIAITIIVVAIPEGLPLAVTISLSFASSKMKKMNNLVRKLASAETMGSASHICTDKTGTLTMNKMTTMACYTLQQTHLMPSQIVTNKLALSVKQFTDQLDFQGTSAWELLVKGVLWNSSARFELNDNLDPSEKGEVYMTKGNVTEQGLLKFFRGAITGEKCVEIKNSLNEDNVLCEIPFTSDRKKASIVVRQPEMEGTDHEVRVYCKGAPDMLLPFTDYVICADGLTRNLDEQSHDILPQELLFPGEQPFVSTERDMFERCIKKFAAKAYRTLLITYRDMSADEYNRLSLDNNGFAKDEDRVVLERELTAVGLFGLQDPLRSTVKDSIQKCHEAGITVIMCTGDNIDTAIAISKDAGIVTEEQAQHEYSCMTGQKFRETVEGLITDKNGKDAVKNMKAFREVKKYLRVLGRSSPADKYLLVTGIQDSQGVVAVTGDGTNDAPALSKADVGFSMGITGTDVAKGASDIILLDDNFSSIIVALRYGRNVYDNVRKFLQFQLTVNVVAMFIVFFSAVILKDSPLNAVQMLWVNLIMDTMAALALATEPPADDILKRQPYPKTDKIMTDIMWRNVFGHAIYQIIALIVVIFAGEGWFVANYTTSCMEYSTAATPVCTKLNPFFTESLYGDNQFRKFWSAKTPPVTVQAFDQDLLKEFTCDFYSQQKDEDLDCKVVAENPTTYPIKTPLDVKDDIKFTYKTQKLLHYTMVFQIFVFMQLFNQINARKIMKGEINVFEGFFGNIMFISITILTFAVQMTMVEIGGKAIKTWPLDTNRNLIALAFGSFELIWGLVIKQIPEKHFVWVNMNDEPAEEEGEETEQTKNQWASLVNKMKASKLKKASQIVSK